MPRQSSSCVVLRSSRFDLSLHTSDHKPKVLGILTAPGSSGFWFGLLQTDYQDKHIIGQNCLNVKNILYYQACENSAFGAGRVDVKLIVLQFPLLRPAFVHSNGPSQCEPQ